MGCKAAVAAAWAEPLTLAAARFQINTPKRLAAWVAQLGHESASLSRLEEGLNYSAVGLSKTWPNRFAQRDAAGKPQPGLPNELALAIERNPQAIANETYANRMGNGSPDTGEGWLYRGRGPIQITGKDNYRAFGEAVGIDVLDAPDALLEPAGGALSAAWFWGSRGLNELADAHRFDTITARINGGQHGRDDRVARWGRARVAFGVV